MELNVMLNSFPGCYLRFREGKWQKRMYVVIDYAEIVKQINLLHLCHHKYFHSFFFILVFFQALVLKELKALRKISRNCVYKAAFYVSSSSNLIHFFYFFLIRNLLFILVNKTSTFYSFIKVITFLFPYPILRNHRWGLTDEILHKGIFSFPTQLAHLFLCMSRS